ncbi:DUF4301 family protein [Aquimarina sp. 2-A2]|uniref:DUF4301 family protein n=1 Tax=Aquimarina sp. 2-A2 TaxID=3382644 RepID=UPI00387F258B
MKTAAFTNKRKYTFDKRDYIQFRLRKITPEIVENQLVTLKRPREYTKVVKPVTLKDGIIKWNAKERKRLLSVFKEHADTLTYCHFIPASGAGSRMLQDLTTFLNDFKPGEESFSSYINRTKQFELSVFFRKIKKFPFYKKLKATLKHLELHTLDKDERKLMIAKTLLYDPNFKFLALPKGLLPFHKGRRGEVLTAFDEQLRQFVDFSDSFQQAEMHFTTLKSAQTHFNTALSTAHSNLKKLTQNNLSISFSHQSEQTDTVSLTKEHTLVRDGQGKVLFRPAGHGVLLSNLNTLSQDIIFISNIDNIAKHKIQKQVADFRKLMIGNLIATQHYIFEILPKLKEAALSTAQLDEAINFLKTTLHLKLAINFEKRSKAERCKILFGILNRPLRICAVVKNTGQPGGGPFWVEDGKGNISMQIVEKAEIDLTDSKQQLQIDAATHFNPVEICCGIKDYEGNTFNLNEFCKDGEGMISQKTYNGMPITILERPGLWNGSMQHWNTLFVEMKPSLFNPVKTINDLLKKAHQ